MRTIIIPAGRDLVSEVLEHIKGNEKDYSSSLIVFPGKRPSHFLRKALASKVGTSFIPPALFSMDEFIDVIWNKISVQKRKLETIDAVALLYKIHRKAGKPLGGGGFLTPDSFFPLGLRIYRDIEELAMEGATPAMVREIGTFAEESLPARTRERLQSLSYFSEEFYSGIETLGFSTRSSRYRAAAQELEKAGLERFERVVIAGFFALTDSEKIVFRKLLLYDNTVILFRDGPGLGEKMKELHLPYDMPESPDIVPEMHFYSSPDTHGQVLALGRILRTKLDAGMPMNENTAIVLPSAETLFPLIRQALPALDEHPYNISLGYPLHRTPLFGFFNNLMEMIASMDGERVYIPDYLKFVLHPYTKNIYFKGKTETTRIMFHALEEELLKTKARNFTSLREIEENQTLFSDVVEKLGGGEALTEGELKAHLKNIHRNTIEQFLSFADVGDFARKCAGLIFFIFNHSTARLHPFSHPFSESFVTSLDTLRRSLMKSISFEERSSYFTFFRKYVSTCHTPFPGTPLKGLQVLGVLETRNLKFDTVIVLDANEELLPDTRRDETLLPFKAREMLGLPTYMDRDRLGAYYFESVIKGAKEIHLCFIESDRAERSRFVEKLLWEKQKSDKNYDLKSYVTPIQYRVELGNKSPEPVPKTEEMAAFLKNYSFSATSLNQYLRCPLQFYYSAVLALRERDEITAEIERDDLGKFVHDVLVRFFAETKGRQLKEADFEGRRMTDIVERLFVKKYGNDVSGALYLLRRQVVRRMEDLLRFYYLPVVRQHKVIVLGCEEEIRRRIDSFNLMGRLDSVEQRDEKIFVIDYKTGSNTRFLQINIEKLDPARRETWSKAIGSLQLPFYLMLYHEQKVQPLERLEALFLMLGRAGVNREIELPFFGESSRDETYASLRTIIFTLLSEIVDPSVPFTRSEDWRKVCPTCTYTYICGTQWVVN